MSLKIVLVNTATWSNTVVQQIQMLTLRFACRGILDIILQVAKVGQYSKALQYLQQISNNINMSPKSYRAR